MTCWVIEITVLATVFARRSRYHLGSIIALALLIAIFVLGGT